MSIMKTCDMAYLDEDIKELFLVMYNSGWVRIIEACGGHPNSTHVGKENLLHFDLEVYDIDRFEKLRSIVNKSFDKVQWGAAIALDRISYQYKDKADKDAFITLLIKLFTELQPHS